MASEFFPTETSDPWFLIGLGSFFVMFAGLGLAGIVGLWDRHERSIPRKREDERHLSLIKRYDVLNHILDTAGSQAGPNVLSQLALLREDYARMLREFSLTSIDFEEGTEISPEIRRKIVALHSSGRSNRVLKTIRCGFEYCPEGEPPRILRKAEVRLGG